MNFPRFVILKSPDRTSPRGESAVMMEGAGQLTGAAAITFFGNPANFHSKTKQEKRG
jgi:hypothetical protein